MLNILALPLAEIIVVGALMGATGALAVLGKRVFFSEALSHGTFPGAVLGVVIGQIIGGDLSLWLFLGAALCCIPLALLMHYLARLRGISPTAAAGIVLTVGYATGVFLLRWFQPLPLKIESFLTGSLLTLNHSDLYGALAVAAATLTVLAACGRTLAFYYFDPVAYRISHGPRAVYLAESITLALLCAAMVVAIPAVGSILSIALLVGPAAGLRDIVPGFVSLVACAAMAGVAVGLAGLGVAVRWNLSAGGSIAVLMGLFYLATRLGLWLRKRRLPHS